MVLQGIVAPLPAFVVTFANGLAFGTWMGWAISLAGHVLASTVCFALARKLGRGPVERLITRKGLEAADRWLGRWGAQAVFFSRLMPGLSFDAVSYAAASRRSATGASSSPRRWASFPRRWPSPTWDTRRTSTLRWSWG